MNILFGAVQIKRFRHYPEITAGYNTQGPNIELVITDQDKKTYKPLLDVWGSTPEKYDPGVPQDALELQMNLVQEQGQKEYKPYNSFGQTQGFMELSKKQVGLFKKLLQPLPILESAKQDMIGALERAQKA